MAQSFQFGRKIRWGDMIIAIVLGAFSLYFLVSGYILQSGASVIWPLVSYMIGLALLIAAKMFKRKATGN